MQPTHMVSMATLVINLTELFIKVKHLPTLLTHNIKQYIQVFDNKMKYSISYTFIYIQLLWWKIKLNA